ncbi:hypothetical protein [Microcoleus vaginatus]|uniref:hypothetical protein n=1 Tax=Microcoleus vaginatus TaxID=119532 RepID=UPI001685FED0|nr:hypothetical protein [Microcoleus sp. FACHB-84]MBD2008421.1 hypothetical protein [Microcoleus sp. FACHB-45]
MSNLSNIPDGGDLPDRYRNVGEQIQAFFDFAENNPDRAVPFFVNIWETQASLTTRALALQGLGVAAKHYHVKEALADWDVLRDIAKEVKGKGEVSNDLTRWAAASALEAIGYSQQSLENLQGGGFTEPLDRIRREIRDRKLAEIDKIKRLNSRGETTAEYERHVEFWLYGPVDELLNDNDSSLNYHDLIRDVISQLHGRGVCLGLMSPNSIVQGTALRQAELIFKESAEIEEYIHGLLEDFLHNSNHETSLRINAAEIINTATDLNRRLKTLSKLLLEETELRNTAVRLLNPYKQELARVESDAYTVLDALSFEYKLDQPEPKSLTIPEIENWLSSANQLQNQITQKFAAAMIAAAPLANKYSRSALVLKQFLQNQEVEIGDWIQKLNNQKSQTANEQSKVESNQLLLKKHFSSASLRLIFYGSQWQEYLAQVDKYKKITNTDYNNFNYNHFQQQLSELLLFKEEIISDLDQRSKKGGDDVEVLFSLMSLSILPIWGYFTYLSFIYLGIWVSILVFFLSPILLIMIILIILIIYAFTIGVKIGQIVTRLNKQWRV